MWPLYAAIPSAVTPFFFYSLTGKFLSLIISLTIMVWPNLTAIWRALLPFEFLEYGSIYIERSYLITSSLLNQAAIQNALTPFLSVLLISSDEFYSISYIISRWPFAAAIKSRNIPSELISKFKSAVVAPPRAINFYLFPVSTASSSSLWS